jgi:Lon protease-like protein
VSTPLPNSPVPIFPLPGVFLFPAQLLPLHVFEPRYRQLVEDSLDGPGRIVIGTIVGEGTPPPVMEVAGLGEIVRHEKLEDGRFHIWVLGLLRVRIREEPSDRLYRRVRCLPFAEVQAPPDEALHLREQLRAATQSRLEQKLQLPDATPTGILTDLLVQTLQAPQQVVEEIFAEESVAERARKALAAHARYPRPRKEGGGPAR